MSFLIYFDQEFCNYLGQLFFTAEIQSEDGNLLETGTVAKVILDCDEWHQLHNIYQQKSDLFSEYSYALQTPPRVAHAKPPGPKSSANNAVLFSC